MKACVDYPRLARVKIDLKSVPICQVRVLRSGSRIFRCKVSFRFSVMGRGIGIVMRRIVIVPCRGMRAGHEKPPIFPVAAGKTGRMGNPIPPSKSIIETRS